MTLRISFASSLRFLPLRRSPRSGRQSSGIWGAYGKARSRKRRPKPHTKRRLNWPRIQRRGGRRKGNFTNCCIWDPAGPPRRSPRQRWTGRKSRSRTTVENQQSDFTDGIDRGIDITGVEVAGVLAGRAVHVENDLALLAAVDARHAAAVPAAVIVRLRQRLRAR